MVSVKAIMYAISSNGDRNILQINAVKVVERINQIMDVLT